MAPPLATLGVKAPHLPLDKASLPLGEYLSGKKEPVTHEARMYRENLRKAAEMEQQRSLNKTFSGDTIEVRTLKRARQSDRPVKKPEPAQWSPIYGLSESDKEVFSYGRKSPILGSVKKSEKASCVKHAQTGIDAEYEAAVSGAIGEYFGRSMPTTTENPKKKENARKVVQKDKSVGDPIAGHNSDSSTTSTSVNGTNTPSPTDDRNTLQNGYQNKCAEQDGEAAATPPPILHVSTSIL